MSYKSHELTSLCLLICAFFFAGYDEPYLLALLTDCIEIRTVEPCLFIQSMPVPKPRLVVRCRQGLVYVASVDHVWCLQAVPLARQIHVLLEDKQFQLALKLTVCKMIMIGLYKTSNIFFQLYRMATILIHDSECTKYRELMCFIWKNDWSSSVFLNVNVICSSHNVQMVLSFMLCVFEHLECHKSSCIIELFTKFNHTTNFWTEYLVLYIAPKEKILWGYIGGVWEPRCWSVPPSPSVWISFIQRLIARPQCGWASSCWNKTFGWMRAIYGTDITQAHWDSLYCSWCSLERRRVKSPHNGKGHRHCQFFETVQAISWWTVFQVHFLCSQQ